MQISDVKIELRSYLRIDNELAQPPVWPSKIKVHTSLYLSEDLKRRILNLAFVDRIDYHPDFVFSQQVMIITVKLPMLYAEAAAYLMTIIRRWHTEECGGLNKALPLRLTVFDAPMCDEVFVPSKQSGHYQLGRTKARKFRAILTGDEGLVSIYAQREAEQRLRIYHRHANAPKKSVA